MKRIGFRQYAAHRSIHLRPEIDTDQIHQPKHAGLRNTHGRANDRVGFLDRQPLVDGFDQCQLQPVDSQPVGDEAGAVLTAHDTFAKRHVGEAGDRGDRFRRGLRPGNDFQQAHIAWRIEEMRNQEVAPERLAHALGQHLQPDSGGVGADRAARPANVFQPAVQRLLDVRAFQHRLNDPIAIGQFPQIVFQVAGFDQPCGAVMHERGGFRFAQPCHRTFRQHIPVVGAVRNDIEQHHGHAGIGDLGGNTRPHRSGADHPGLADCGRHQMRSRMVAIP